MGSGGHVPAAFCTSHAIPSKVGGPFPLTRDQRYQDRGVPPNRHAGPRYTGEHSPQE
jgi:hypothetical protein